MTENRDLYHHDYYYSPFNSADPYALMATPTDPYPPTMATTTTAYSDYFQGSSASMTVDHNAVARALGGDKPPSSYYISDVFDPAQLAGGKGLSFDMDALLMDSSPISAGPGGGDGSTTGGSRTPVSPNSSVSSSSTEAAGQDEELSSARMGGKTAADTEVQDQPDEGKAADCKSPSSSKKQAGKAATGGGGRKKGEKRQRQPRFAFMTKSEVDHLEDGYRWRKYGQKAVKNSPYPRSYYRCTTQKCTVKKRVERSHQDPSVVITTYEGQHTHPSPAALRGAAAGAALTHSHMLAAAATAAHATPPMPGFRRDLLMLQHQQQQLLQQQQQQQQDVMLSQTQGDAVSNPTQLLQQQQYQAAQSNDHHYHHQQLSEFTGNQGDHAAGLLQDMVVPSFSSSSFFGENLLQQSYRWST